MSSGLTRSRARGNWPQAMLPWGWYLAAFEALDVGNTELVALLWQAALIATIQANVVKDARVRSQEASFIPILDRDLALGCLTVDNSLRRAATLLIKSPAFDKLIIVLIFISSVCLALPYLEYPSYDRRCTQGDEAACTLMASLAVADIVFTALFTCELLLKVIVFGFACVDGAYLHSSWNWLDATVVLVSISGLVLGSLDQHEFGFVRVLRLLRALRPLRMISRAPGMRVPRLGNDTSGRRVAALLLGQEREHAAGPRRLRAVHRGPPAAQRGSGRRGPRRAPRR